MVFPYKLDQITNAYFSPSQGFFLLFCLSFFSLLSCKINLSDPLNVHFCKVTQTHLERNQSPGVKALIQMKESQGQSVASTGQILGNQKSQFGFGAQQRKFWCSGDKTRAWLVSKKTPDWQILMGFLKMECAGYSRS